MGRNGKQIPVFPVMVNLINSNVNKVISSNTLLLGEEPGRNAGTSYIYCFIKLGYLRIISGKVRDKDATFYVVKGFPAGYSSVKFMQEYKALKK